MMHYALTEPERTASEKGRRVTYTWYPNGKAVPGGGEVSIVTLTVMHHKRRGGDFFGITLRVENEQDYGTGRVRSFMVFDGVRLESVPAGNRYSASKLADAADHAINLVSMKAQEDDPDDAIAQAVKAVFAKAQENVALV